MLCFYTAASSNVAADIISTGLVVILQYEYAGIIWEQLSTGQEVASVSGNFG